MKTSRRLSLIILFAFSLPLSGADRPNILWFTAEDMSANLGCYGDEYAHTPNIDAFAKRSVLYRNAFATAPVCSPARSCLITGVYATTLGTQRLRSDFPLPDYVTGWPSFLRRSGYYTTNNVKTDYNTSSEKRLIAESWDESSEEAHFRNRPDKAQPFFHVFNDMTTHQSRSMVWPFKEFVEKVQSKLSAEEKHDPKTAPVPPYYPDTPLIRKTIARNYDCITVMDRNFGQMLEELEEDDLAENTIVFLFSDHGAGLPRHKRALYDSGMHVPLIIHFPKKWEHLAPAKPGTEIDRLVSFVDFPATVLSLLELDIPSYMQGLPFIGDQQMPPREFVFGARDRVDEVYDFSRSVRTKDYLYIRNFMPYFAWHQPAVYPDGGRVRSEFGKMIASGKMTPEQEQYAGVPRPREELYKVGEDPLNLANLIAEPAHAAIRQTMRDRLRTTVVGTRDSGFLPEDVAHQRSKGSNTFEAAANPGKYQMDRILSAAWMVGNDEAFEEQRTLMGSRDAAVRYWATIGLRASERTEERKTALKKALKDDVASIRIEAAAALGETDVLIGELGAEEPETVLRAIRALELVGSRSDTVTAAAQKCLDEWRGRNESSLGLFIRFSCFAILGMKAEY
ncbi:MAG: sulfatase-like hydrolase/transferase [Verrucomicrobiota bacterium]